MKNKLITALISVVIAFGLWLYVITVEQPNSTQPYYNIPVALQGERILMENGLMLISGQDSTVSMTVQGNRSDLSKINSGNISVVADLTRIYEAGTVELPYDYSFPGEVASNALSVQSREPDTITLVIAQRVSKEVPVRIAYTGDAPDPSRYIVDKENAILDYPMVMVTGPDMVIEKIDHARIDVDLTDRTQSFNEQYRYVLCDEEGNAVDVELVTTNVAEVRLELKIQLFKNIELMVTVVDGGGATEATSKIEIEPATIRVSGSEQVLSKLTKLNLGTVNLGDLTKEGTLSFPIVLDEGVTNMTGVTDAIVNVSFPNLASKTLTVTNIQAVNVPEGMTHELVTQALKISVRGPRDLILRMTRNDITIVVDFANMTVGTATIKPQVIFSEKYAEVGQVGSCSVSVTLKEATEGTAP